MPPVGRRRDVRRLWPGSGGDSNPAKSGDSAAVLAASAEPSDPLGGRRAWAVWATAVAIYLLAVFHRTSLGVAGIIAAERFHISASQLATFAVVQAAVYAAMQVPVGAMLDRYGSKALLVTGTVTMTLARTGFALTHSFAGGVIARIFVGAGDAMIFVSVIRLVASWFPPLRAPMVTQATGFIGQIGALVAAGPLAAALHNLGWRTTFLSAAAMGVVLGIVLIVVVKDSPYSGQRRTKVRMGVILKGVASAWSNPEPASASGPTSRCNTARRSSASCGVPVPHPGQGLSTGTASVLLSVMVLATILSSPLFAAAATRYPYSRSTVVLSVLGVMVAAWTIVLVWPGHTPLWMLLVLVVVTAVGGPASLIGFDLARTFNPPTRTGSATGIVNVGGFVASLITVFLIGIVLDHVAPGGPTTYNTDSFRAAMSTQYLVWGFGAIQLVRLRHLTRREIHARDEFRHLLPERLREPD